MTLFDAIRQMHEGQGIEQCGVWVVRWGHGKTKADYARNCLDLLKPASLSDLPRPKTLREAIKEAWPYIWDTNNHQTALFSRLAAAGVDLEQVVKEGK